MDVADVGSAIIIYSRDLLSHRRQTAAETAIELNNDVSVCMPVSGVMPASFVMYTEGQKIRHQTLAHNFTKY